MVAPSRVMQAQLSIALARTHSSSDPSWEDGMPRWSIAISTTAATFSIAVLVPAGAQPVSGIDSYAAGARARALEFSVFGDRLADVGPAGTFMIADTAATVDSTPRAGAGGLAVQSSLFSSPGAQSATDADTSARDCAKMSDAVPADLQLSVPSEAAPDLVCVTTEAELVNGRPVSSSTGSDVVLELKAPALIGETPLADLVVGVQENLGLLFESLVPITEPIEEATQIQLSDILDGLLDEVQEGAVLLRVTLAPASSVSGLSDAGLTANAVSNGVLVELLPSLPGGALAVAHVGSATAGVMRDAITGVPTLSGEAAVVNVTYPNRLLGGLDILAGALGDTLDTITSQFSCADTNPLAPVFCVDAGGVIDLDADQAKTMGFDYGPATVGRASSAVTLRALSAAPGGGVMLKVGGLAAASTAGQTIPVTGGADALPLALFLLSAGIAATALVRRSRTT